MGQVLHGCATTTHAVRAAIQRSRAPVAELAARHGLNRKTAAIDRTSKFAFVELHERVSRRTAGDFLRRLIEAVPYTVRTVLTDNGTHDELHKHLAAFVGAYNFAKRLKPLAGLAPFQAVCKDWTDKPTQFRLPPDHLASGRNT